MAVFAQSRATASGMQVKRDLTSKDTNLWSSGTDLYRFDSVNEIVSGLESW